MLTRPAPVMLTLREQAWVDRVEQLAAGFGATIADDDAAARLPLGHLRSLSESGLDRALLPAEYGGEALSYAALGRIVQSLAARHPAVATVWLMHVGAAHALVSMSEPETAAFFAQELRDGRRFANALSEPAGGNLFLQSQQDVRSVEHGWAFSGRKMFVSGSEAADHFFMNGRLDGQPAFFGVTADQTVTFPPIEETMGMRATRSRTVVFDDTRIASDRLCRAPEPGYTNLITAGFAFISIGIAVSALDELRDHARKQKAPGAPLLAEAAWVRYETGLTWARVEAARLLAERAMWLADTGSPEAMPAATEAKMLANEVAKETAALAVKVCGGSGYLMKSPVQRIFRDAQAGAIMAYSVPFSSELVGGWVLGPG